MTRARKKAFIIGGIVLALPVLFLIEERFRGKWALAKLKLQLAAKGEKLTVEECRPPFAEAQDNCHPDLMSAVTLITYNSASDAAPSALRMVAPGKARVLYSLKEWPVVGSVTKGKPTNSNWLLLETALAGSTQGLSLARMALSKPAFDAKVQYSMRNFQIPHLAPVKRLAQCLNADALLQLHKRNAEGTLDDLESHLRLAALMRDECTLISQLVRIAIASMAIGPSWQALQTPGWDDGHLGRLQ